eukprot:963329-Amphidinium_carterae.2
MMGPERVYQNGPKQYVGFDHGRQWIASLILPEVNRTPVGRPPSPPQGTSVPVFGAQQSDASGNRNAPETARPSSFAPPVQGTMDPGNLGRSVLGSSGANLGTGGTGSGMPPNQPPVQGGREQARSASPSTINDERILGRYFTRDLKELEKKSEQLSYRTLREEFSSLSTIKTPKKNGMVWIQHYLRCRWQQMRTGIKYMSEHHLNDGNPD